MSLPDEVMCKCLRIEVEMPQSNDHATINCFIVLEIVHSFTSGSKLMSYGGLWTLEIILLEQLLQEDLIAKSLKYIRVVHAAVSIGCLSSSWALMIP